MSLFPIFSLAGRAGLVAVASALLFGMGAPAMTGAAPSAKTFSITIDATALTPPTWWYVPGMTPIIWSLDPESTEAFRTTEPRTLSLAPGAYRFGTFTFDFPFHVLQDGTLEFASSLDHCVKGRGLRTLTIQCGRTQPYSGRPDY